MLMAKPTYRFIYDSIVWEMSTVHFALACHLLDQEGSISSGSGEATEHEIVENLNQSIHYVEVKIKVAPDDMVPTLQYRYARSGH